LGLLQQSVWIWPDEIEQILREIIEVNGVPECFCGFESRRLFLCTDQEVVASAWNFEEIHRHHRIYLDRTIGTTTDAREAASITELARAARFEWRAYQDAFARDPLLPRVLLPRGYQGERVHQEHLTFVRVCETRFGELAER
jgi:DNA-binding transcriptional regulator PaaX